MKILILLTIAALLGGCTYDEVESFGRGVNSAAGSYYRQGYTPVQPVVMQPVVY